MNFPKTSSSWLGYPNLWLTYRCQSSMNQEKPRLCFHYLGQQAIQSVHFWTILWFLQTTWMWSLWSWWHGESQNLKWVHKQDPNWWIKNARCLRLKKAFEMQQLLNDKTKPKKKPQKIHLEPTKDHDVFLLKELTSSSNQSPSFFGVQPWRFFRSNWFAWLRRA